MGGYFSFDRMITTTFVKVVYFLGFVALTAAGIALVVWASMQLNNATISRALGWRYVAIGVALVLVGNIAWRVFCELWVVLFGIHSELVSVGHRLNLNGLHYRDEPVESKVIAQREKVLRPREVVVHQEEREVPRHGVLGLS